jgi:hypothetical protein
MIAAVLTVVLAVCHSANSTPDLIALEARYFALKQELAIAEPATPEIRRAYVEARRDYWRAMNGVLEGK